MTTHRRNGNNHYSLMNTTASKRLPLHRLRLRYAILVSQLSLFWFSILIVHASTTTHGSPSFSVSQTSKIDSHKDGSANKLVALNVGSSSSIGNNIQSQQQPYPYKDEDFVIPTIKQQPRYIQRHLNPQSSTGARSMATSSAHWIALTLTAVSFSKALYYKLNNTFRSTKVMSDDDGENSDVSTVLESTNIEENKDVTPSTTDHQSADSNLMPPEWKEQFDHLIVEATSLREQLSMIQQMLEKQQLDQSEKSVSSPEIIEDNADIQKTDTADDTIGAMTTEIQSLKESVQYWKRVAEMNEQQVSNVVQVERQNGIQQLEQLKMDMLQMVDEERVAMMKEFTTMIQELRDSLHNQT